MRDRGCLVFRLDGGDETGCAPFRRGFWVRKFIRAFSVPRYMAERFQLGGEPLSPRLGALCKEQPIRRGGMGVRHAVFEPTIAEPERMRQRGARVGSGALQTRDLARHACPVVVE